MRPLRYCINVTLDGCCDHRAIAPDEELHRHAAESIAQVDALLLGRLTYEMMEAAWRPVGHSRVRPYWMPDWMEPFARTIDAARKYVVSPNPLLLTGPANRGGYVGYDAFEITGCWATVLAKGAMHKAHSHPNNFLSGVHYVGTQPGADTIDFHDPRNQASVIRPPVVELTAENTDQVVVRVTNGSLLLFPSYRKHSVETNMSEEERISVSFNIMFSSFTERLSKPLW